MKQTWKKLFAFVCAFTLVAAPATFNGDSMWSGADGTIVSAAENSTDYTITIPATLSVANAGWNAATPITAKVKEGDTFDSSKQLTVTASSENEWKLKSGENSIAYKIASATDQDKSYSDATAITSLKISADQLNNGTYSAPFGIVVDDYNDMSAGEYTDTVTFTAKVEDAAPATVLAGALVDGAIIKVNFKWRSIDRGDYVQGTYSASSGTFTVSKGGNYWGRDNDRAVYKVEKSGDNIIIGAGYYDYNGEGMVWTFNTTNDTYTTTNGDMVNDMPEEYGLISVTLNGTDITSQLTKQ